jgi:hypothetical protein
MTNPKTIHEKKQKTLKKQFSSTNGKGSKYVLSFTQPNAFLPVYPA